MKKPLLFPLYENSFVNSYREFMNYSCLSNQKHLMGKSFFLLLFFMSLMSFQEINAQTCVSEKLTVRIKSFNYSGTDTGGPDIRVVATAKIGTAAAVTTACYAVDNIATLPFVPQPEFITSQPVTCGAALPVVTVSYNAHEDNALVSNCNVQTLLGEQLQQSTLNIPIDISTIRTIPSHSITQNVTVGSGATQWDIVFEVVWDNIVNVCGINATPNDSKGYANVAAMTAAGGTEGCTAHDYLPGTTFSQYSTVRSDQYGTLGIVDYISADQTPASCSANTRATRTGTEKLYLKDSNTGLCTGAIIPKTGNGTNSGSFNPEWTNLTPNTDYIIFLTTTVDASCTHLSSICVNYYGIPPMFPAGAVYNDDGKGGGSSGNCVREGGEDASIIPAGLFAKLKLNSSASASQAVAVQANGSFAFAGTIATGTYTVFLDNNSTLSDVTSTLPTNWSGTASWTGTITAGVLAPAFTGFCLRDVVAGPCSGNHYVQWSLNPWTAGSLTKNITLGGGLTMNTTITNPNGILAPGYPQMFADIPSVLIQTNSASKSITWTSVFNQKVSGVSFSLYDIDNVGTLKELLDVKGYNGATVVNPIITVPFASSVVVAGSSMSGTLNNVPTYSPFAKANISFNQPIDRVEINYRNNKNVYYPRPALLLVSDFTIFCPVAVNNPDKIDLSKSAPTGSFAKGDTVTYTFRFNNGDATNKTVDFTDALPTGFTWVANSYISPLATTPNAYGGTNNFTLTGASVPPGVTTFTIDAIANGAIGVNNNQASFTTNGNTYQSDNPYTTAASDPTPVTLIAPPPVAPITMTKSVDLSSVSSTGEVKFTYSFSNTNASAITVNFTDEIQPDSVRFKPASLVRTGATGGTANVYSNVGYLSITGLSIPAGSSSISVNALISGQPAGTYSNYATILPTAAAFRAKPNNSNSVDFTVTAPVPALDSDNDGIPDTIDIDDDNDGILDTEEECFGFRGQNTNGAWLGNTTSTATFSFPSSVSQSLVANYNDTQIKYYVNSNGGQPRLSRFGNMTYTASFSPAVPASEIAFYIFDLDGALHTSSNASYTISVNGSSANIPFSSANIGSPAMNYNSGTGVVSSAGVLDNQRILLKGNNTTLVSSITITGTGISTADDVAYSFFGKKNCDTDNDNIPNSLDLDSDDDGCSDAFEAGATTSTTANFQFPVASVGTNGLSSTVESNDTPTATTTYTSTYANATNDAIKNCCPTSTAPTLSATTKSNVCPVTTADISSLVSSTCPVGSSLEWHTVSTGFSAANLVASASTVGAGTYYPVCFSSASSCYSPAPATGVTVTITTCAGLFTITQPAAITKPVSTLVSGTSPSELTPTGGTGPYIYSNGSSDPACVQPVGATALPTNVTIDPSTGAYSYTTPSTAGTYYFCVKVCDSTTPTANCAFATYKVTVTPPACNAGTVAPGVN